MILAVEQTIYIGSDTYESSVSHANSYGVTFEDNLETGYFYAVETAPSLKVLDALFIYNVEDVTEKDTPRQLQIAWSDNGLVASLLINNYCHAIFDFENKAGYCRNGFPGTSSKWTKVKERKLTDQLIIEIFKHRK